MNKNMLILVSVVLLSIVFFIVACNKYGDTYTPKEITNYQNVDLPLDSPEEAIEYSLSFESVRTLLLDQNGLAYDKYGANWQANARLVSPIGGSGMNFTELYKEKMKGEGYIVNWGKGKRCNSYDFQLKFSLDGTLLTEQIMPSWGNCK